MIDIFIVYVCVWEDTEISCNHSSRDSIANSNCFLPHCAKRSAVNIYQRYYYIASTLHYTKARCRNLASSQRANICNLQPSRLSKEMIGYKVSLYPKILCSADIFLDSIWKFCSGLPWIWCLHLKLNCCFKTAIPGLRDTSHLYIPFPYQGQNRYKKYYLLNALM